MTPGDGPQNLQDLIQRFRRNADEYRSSSYNEAQLRQEFLNPLFRLLGWDMDNAEGASERYKQVIHEDSIKINGDTKAPDYCFRIGGIRKFFVEAKKPAIRIKDDAAAAYQLRRYAWSSKLPLSILTNFEEFAIYDCRIKPSSSDKASTARIEYFTFTEYPQEWEHLLALFSLSGIVKGSFDRFVESSEGKRGTAQVDDAFLAEIESWRDRLARSIALRNLVLSPEDLNFAVQKIIDRIIFLRISEDRGIEPYRQLSALTNGHNVYSRLSDLFRRADYKYNSGLFHFEDKKDRHEPPDTFTLDLSIDDKVLIDILESLYFPESPYEFSVFPADILGHVYEQFLGKVIRLTAGHQAKVEEKPEVKKAGGVYYTPTYVVDYIVRNTIGTLLKGKTPRQASKMKIVDPTCGSGSFLLGAYQYLLDWYRSWYEEHSPTSRKNAVYQGPKGDWRLTVKERKKILLDSIYGVDIDAQAVEVTKLSLLLTVLENETDESLSSQLMLFHKERVLPDLGENIKCGNTLIASDFYGNVNGALFEDGPSIQINPFDWNEAFPGVFRSKGFDVVVGNPPWGAFFSETELEYLRHKHKRVVDRMVDSYIYFLDQAARIASPTGYVGFIVPGTLLNQVDARSIRKLLLSRGLQSIVNLGQGVFGPKVLNTSCIVVGRKRHGDEPLALRDLSSVPLAARKDLLGNEESVDWAYWKRLVEDDPHCTFFVGGLAQSSLLARLRRKHVALKDILIGEIQRGVTPDVVEAHVLVRRDAVEKGLEKPMLRPSISGAQIKRYHPWRADRVLVYTTRDTDLACFPNVRSHLSAYRNEITCPEVRDSKHPWYALHRPRDPEIFRSPKFIGLTTARTIEVIYDERKSVYVTDAMYLFAVTPEYDPWALMAVLHSKVFLFLYRVANQGEGRVIPQVKASKLQELPVPAPNRMPAEMKQLRQLSQRLIALNAAQGKEAAPLVAERLERQKMSITRRIDDIVYELYGVSKRDVAMIDQAV
ncbi:MAG: N-6 DNA methylase [Bryobacteraceae bacterium]|jgi:predicted type IV restriction endonuclease